MHTTQEKGKVENISRARSMFWRNKYLLDYL